MSRLPIRLRVTTAFAVAMAAVLAGSGLFLYLRLSSHLALALDRQLQLRAEDLAALVRQRGASLATDSTGRFIEHGESYAQLLRPDGEVVDATEPLGRFRLLDPAQLRAARSAPIFLDEPTVTGLNESSRVLATLVKREGQRFVLVVGATRQNDAETLARFRDELLIAGPIALVIASLAGYLLAGISLRQVESMRRRAAAITGETVGERLPVPPTGDEVQRLGETLNAMLGRLEDALQRERDFVADAGHELRTPLALLRTELELALRGPSTPAEFEEAIRRSSREVERLSQLAESLLLIARSERGELPLRIEEVSVDELLAATQRRLEWQAVADSRHVYAEPAVGLVVHGDRLRLEQALANLVDNALRYGDGDVRLTAIRTDGRTELHVTDEGAGFPPAFVEHAFERFSRADAARSGGDGSGLGLAIVRTIAEAHDGSAHAAHAPTNRTDVWISLPNDVD